VRQSRVLKIVAGAILGLLVLMGFQSVIGRGIATLMWKNLPTLTPLEARFQASFIQAQDLPLGWHRSKRGIQFENVPGAEARFLVFYGTWDSDKSWVNVGQDLILYPDQQAATNAYDKRITEYTEAWIIPSELEIVSRADRMHVTCLPGYINGMHYQVCEAIGLYGDMLSILGGNVFDNRWLTMEDFQAVLEAMDRRIVAAMEGNGQ
jgi:hypothetical protein